MNIKIHWERFIKRYWVDFNSITPKKFGAEFSKRGKKWRIQLICQEVKDE